MICDRRGDHHRAEAYRNAAAELTLSLEENAWDGQWYLRAFDDNGNPVGAASAEECRIDSIAQSWAALCGSGDPVRVRQAIESAYRMLVLPPSQMVLLFTPPFHHSKLDPGYIKAYPPGIRENGGHYTHAAAWLAAAFAESGDGDRAFEVFRYLLPLSHSASPEQLQRFRVEPYVAVADIYSHQEHHGMGGWSWYTGSAAWIYRVGIEWILGLRLHGDHLTVTPCIPKNWKQYRITYRHSRAVYRIEVLNPKQKNAGVKQVEFNGTILVDHKIPLEEDGEYVIRIMI